jgi:maltooligosyltrehalose trehalohydrolase
MSIAQTATRRLPVGAEVQEEGGVHFRVWAPRRNRVAVVLEADPSLSRDAPQSFPLAAEESGYWSGHVAEARAGTRYRFRVDDGETLYPDPASRFQPDGVHGASEVIDPRSYAWEDAGWKGLPLAGQVVYEMHVGTFTPEGTLSAAARELPELASLGITLVELMPVAEFVGRFGWGYDGVDLFAPTRLYGRPDDLRRFVDLAHAEGIGVLLDVVYNHFGPTGNYLGAFTRDYFSTKHATDWGEALNFDGEGCGPVREFFIANAGYWIDEFHIDGLRLDAIHAIVDDSADHILAAITRRVRQAGAGRKTLVVAENEHQEPRVLRSPADGGFGLDAAWNDDFHHSARVAATGHNEFYYGDYQGTPQELLSAVKYGYLYQGQWNRRQGRRRGAPAWDISAERFVVFLQNHDQVANSGHGLRMHALTSPGRYRALTALLLLAPQTPLIFQGQEFAASAPFLFFADHDVDLAKLVREGRQEFLRQFASLAGPESPLTIVDPCDPHTFAMSKLDLGERQAHAPAYAMHRDLLQLRREDPVFSSQRGDRLHGAVIGAEAFLLRFRSDEDDDRLLLVNLGCDLVWTPVAEPLAAPPQGRDWELLWSSEDPRYGGSGTGLLDTKQWRIPGHAAIALGTRTAGVEI